MFCVYCVDIVCSRVLLLLIGVLCGVSVHHASRAVNEMKWNESGFRPLFCTYRLNLARKTSCVWWDEWDNTALHTQDSKLEPWRSEAEHVTSRSRRFPTILSFTSGWGRNILVSFKPPRRGNEPWTLVWKAAVLTTTPGPRPCRAVNNPPVIMVNTTFVYNLYNIGPTSKTLGRRCTNVIQMFSVYWVRDAPLGIGGGGVGLTKI